MFTVPDPDPFSHTHSTLMKILLCSAFVGLVCILREAHAVNVNTTLTTSIPALYSPPTTTALAIVSAYLQAVQLCRPALDAVEQAAVQEYNERTS
ncbi:hypothetical protein DFH07DRAFT_961473 [Mycena maculata]|uniref:Uncharacterized protein n=1 Tax=Mycena maculata TaxID=230809 RepID=A0AAD7N992_9AGAR|nr:hypothetical protein DFH07DRAFT_961473 [Mycena maculata]